MKIAAAAFVICALFFSGNTLPADSFAEHSTASAGGIVLQMENGWYLVADEICYDGGIGEAHGAVRLYFGDGMLLAEKLCYSLDDGSLWGENIRFRINNLYVRADSVESAEKGKLRHIILHHGRIYGGEPGRHSPNIAAEAITIPGTAAAWIDGASVRIGNWRLFSMGRWRLKLDGIAMCFRGKYGCGRDLGICGRNSIVCAVKSKGRAGVNLDFFSKRGVLMGPLFRWNGNLDENGATADLFGGMILDGGNRGFDLLGAPIGRRRSFFDCNYLRNFNKNWSMSGALHRWSDSFVLRDFRPEKYWNNQYPISHFEVTRQWRRSLLTATAVLDPNDFQRGTKESQEIRYQIIPHQIFDLPAVCHGAISFGAKKMEFGECSPENSFIDGFCELAAPIRWRTIASIRPMAAARAVFSTDDWWRNSSFREFWQLGFDLNVLCEGFWGLSAARWDVGSLCHKFVPVIQYRHSRCSHEAATANGHISTDTNLPIIDIGETRDLENFHFGHCLRIGVENTLQARSLDGKSTRTVAEVRFYEDLHPWQAYGPCGKSDIYSMVHLNPANFISMKLLSRSDIHTFAVNELRVEAALRDGNLWEMSLGGDYLRDCARQYSFGFIFNPTSRSQIGGSIRYDAHLHRVIAQRHHFFHRFDRNWSMDIRLTIRATTAGVERRNIRFGLHLDY